jgi:mannose-6-phosphate isomerase-like protein (cupin superfamily)
MGNHIIKPRILSIKDFKYNGPDSSVPGSRYTEIINAEGFGKFGLYFMEPGSQTTTFSLESDDDKTADEYYGPCFEFYYLLVGEITMYWGKDAEKVIRGEEHALLFKAGDFGCWEKGWKYSAKNTGDIPVTFFWGLGEPPEGVKRRMIET